MLFADPRILTLEQAIQRRYKLAAQISGGVTAPRPAFHLKAEFNLQ